MSAVVTEHIVEKAQTAMAVVQKTKGKAPAIRLRSLAHLTNCATAASIACFECFGDNQAYNKAIAWAQVATKALEEYTQLISKQTGGL